MTSKMNEVMNILQKISLDMSNFAARQEQLEINHEQSCRTQDEALNELREVLNEVVLGEKRPERDKELTYNGGELYSPNDKPFDLADLVTPITGGNHGGVPSIPASISANTQALGSSHS